MWKAFTIRVHDAPTTGRLLQRADGTWRCELVLLNGERFEFEGTWHPHTHHGLTVLRCPFGVLYVEPLADGGLRCIQHRAMFSNFHAIGSEAH